MGHGHEHHNHNANRTILVISFFIITAFMFLEAIGGYLTNSLALLADAGHMLSDAISLGVAVMAMTVGAKAADYSKTYGYRRFEILAAVFNGVTLILISLYIFYEALERFSNPPEVASTGMLIIAVIGLSVNILVAWMMMKGGDTKENLNVRAAFLHVLGDLFGSIGAIIAALLIMFFGWGLADPLASVIVSALVLISGWKVSKNAVHILMEGTPSNVDVKEIADTMKREAGVTGVHDLHVWSISSGLNALSSHVTVDGNKTVRECQVLLQSLEKRLEDKNIHHVTLQIEHEIHHHKGALLCNMKHSH
ncbi:cation diffusion facilitator family transporter [Salinicoccus hispanicus]|uniref:Cation diffusion facilitator family transporter n=1 Tax=Salinicoccus hispanicus TaxID=157225 RepID=A0A6N8U7L3_9STAP|nr:cation diffusion facilitator family transporter [Salinicoccus hispanicus]MXQ51639.1 cation diffusion facilitator family transporter [Salinicoccus hispanicus]